jgi:hypothetical protein
MLTKFYPPRLHVMKSPNRFDDEVNTGVVQVSREVLHLESVP